MPASPPPRLCHSNGGVPTGVSQYPFGSQTSPWVRSAISQLPQLPRPDRPRLLHHQITQCIHRVSSLDTMPSARLTADHLSICPELWFLPLTLTRSDLGLSWLTWTLLTHQASTPENGAPTPVIFIWPLFIRVHKGSCELSVVKLSSVLVVESPTHRRTTELVNGFRKACNSIVPEKFTEPRQPFFFSRFVFLHGKCISPPCTIGFRGYILLGR